MQYLEPAVRKSTTFNLVRLLFLPLFCFFTNILPGQDAFAGYEKLFTPPLTYTVFKASGNIKTDGKLDEPAWQIATWSAPFTDIEGDQRPAPYLKTRMKMCWDTANIYIAAELQEPHIWGNVMQHDEVVFRDNDFEIFIDPDGDTENYFEIEVNALNTIFDLFLPKAYRHGGPAMTTWDVKGLRSAVSLQGTLNDASDMDQQWTVEMAIPFSSLDLGGRKTKSYRDWRINFSRVEWDVDIKSKVYKKVIDSLTHRPKAEHNWVWSPQGVINMHQPERWGYLHFSQQNNSMQEVNIAALPGEQVKKYLWLLYYKQQAYKREHQQYATSLAQLNFNESFAVAGLNCNISLQAIESQFRARVISANGDQKWQINHEGKINQY